MQVDEPAVWSELGHAQLDNGLVAEAIASYLRSNDTTRSSDVIERSKEVSAIALPHMLMTPFYLLPLMLLLLCCLLYSQPGLSPSLVHL